ncbi:TraR/DksA family transcriptional regulator [Maritalea mediterranea]|uniref:TraR/DksA family transcriptional regulator n=1 Tax=Maritalea mediterranea TaxID=2909667 RepID=A0ABS9E789_9HYPH|nr:TraR/DksA family transcriptional regulator [Maritalea mediterranea]MCF4098702.1 TraR/DksA family transcriptional regulator [Maritalea mediterranea]
MRDIETYKQRLLDRQKELDVRLHNIEDQLDDEPNPDTEERAVEREDDEMLEGLGNAGKAELQQIEHALTRIKNGTFGTCVECGEDISDERLNAIPYATKCKNCM